MALVALTAASVVLMTNTGPNGAWLTDLCYSTWGEVSKYLDSGSTKDLPKLPELPLPEEVQQDLKAIQLYQEKNPITVLDGALAAGTAGGIVLLFIPGVRWIGAGLILGSLGIAWPRGSLKMVAASGAALAFAINNPAAAVSIAGAAMGAAASVGAQAIEISSSVVGLLVTVSGALAGYLLVRAARGIRK
jgi:hypothetical protein